jgi:hypothetical protein
MNFVKCKTCHKEFENNTTINGKTLVNCQECREKFKLKDDKLYAKKKEAKQPGMCSNPKCCLLVNGFIGINGKPTKKCEKCYTKDREADVKRREKSRAEKEKLCSLLGDNERVCTSVDCRKTFVIFMNRRNEESKYCPVCYEHLVEYESARNQAPERREYCRKLGQTVKPYAKLRSRKLLEDPDKHREHNNQVHKEWKAKNPEKCQEYAEKYAKIPEYVYQDYKYKCFRKNIEFDMTLEEFTGLLDQPCHYCGNSDSFGVDRINSRIGYIMENSVACCSTCNIIKKTMDTYTFSRSVNNILYYQGIQPGSCSYYKSGAVRKPSYSDYKRSSKKRNIPFEISEEQFLRCLRNARCYLCGVSDRMTCLGIDRVNSSKGYNGSNIEPCCATCNYMKNNVTLKDFLNHLQKVYKHFQVSQPREFEMSCNLRKIHDNKTKEELEEITIQRNQERHGKTIEKAKEILATEKERKQAFQEALKSK